MPSTDPSARPALWCVVPAAGRGTRFRSAIPKQYLPLAGKSLLLHTLERLAAHPHIAGLVVALAPGDAHWPQLTQIAGKPVRIADGGDERADSVLAGLHALARDLRADDFVLVHDAARPCVRAEDISQLIELGMPAGGALLAAPLRDTLKRADADGRSATTESRESRWRALTPQLFRHGELVAALESARAAGIAVTDEAMAMERAGHRPLLVEGAESNIKVTTPADFALAEFLLAREV
ncbi:MAG: 2-C-methyl-D-erythritol 4-phosphate cytidylyltransferase [Gammaproteobacteria bacterium]|nr:MAG: 2-C-methyl-D-erythritol 4-phosphate cytidylyltransferase [Gammaproteobacteria bacterium]